MSRTAVLDTVADMTADIVGIASSEVGEPDELPSVTAGQWRAYTWLDEIGDTGAAGVGEGSFRSLTFGTSGPVIESYNVTIKVYLGNEDMTKRNAQAQALLVADRFRARFASDYHLRNGAETDLVWMCSLVGATANFSDFKQLGEKPRVSITLRVQELIAASAAAQD